MYDRGWVITGIVIFVALVAFPFWYNAGKASPAPKLELPKNAKQCIEPTAFMKAEHMQMLNDWRNSVVRDGNRIYTAGDGKKYTMSLQNTCLECHTSKANFCDRCHNYANVSPYCWSCHIAPAEPKEKG